MKHFFRLWILIGGLTGATAVSEAQFGWGYSNDRNPFYFNSQAHCRSTLSLLSNRYGTPFSSGTLDAASFFFANLSRRHHLNSWQLYGHLDQYAASGGNFSPEVLNLALQRPSQSASELVTATDETRALLDRYQNATTAMLPLPALNVGDETRDLPDRDQTGRLDEARFRERLKDNLKNIRKLAKTIRDDDSLEFVEGGSDEDLNLPKTADSLDGLVSGVDTLQRLASQINQNLQALETGRGTDSSRVITREQLSGSSDNAKKLSGFSIRAMARAAEKLAKDLEKKAKRI